jgi:hypothetical protein
MNSLVTMERKGLVDGLVSCAHTPAVPGPVSFLAAPFGFSRRLKSRIRLRDSGTVDCS